MRPDPAPSTAASRGTALSDWIGVIERSQPLCKFGRLDTHLDPDLPDGARLLPTFRLAHLSDPHLSPPPPSSWRSVAGKRLLSRIAWARKKRARHLPEILSRLLADIHGQSPDHTVITGDLTNFATPEEFAAARSWLEAMGPADQITVSPGNHDALDGEHAGRFAPWTPWLGDDGDAAAFPKVRVRGPVAVFNLCSALPTALHLAQGELGADQLSRLEALLPQYAHLRRVLILHHPAAPGVVSGRKALRDREALADIVRRHGCELILHGHAHTAPLNAIEGPNGRRVPVLGVPSASSNGGGHDTPARWHLLEFDGAEGPIRVTARGISAGGMAELGAYSLTV